ncbi:hypothetical protein AwEntero_18530 [Enterobacterales bacterium]|nr:hypothetical protein AwEntero_18530 [Enterobacterales bacterium]
MFYAKPPPSLPLRRGRRKAKANGQMPNFLLIYIAAKAQSKMAPDERFETYGSNPEIRGRRSRDILRRERK